MWQNKGEIWVYKELPFISIEPFKDDGGELMWRTCCGGRPVPQIPPSASLGELIMQTIRYYDERIEMTPVKERWEQ